MKKAQLNIEIYHFIKKILGNKIAKQLHFSLKKKRLVETNIIFIHVPKAAGTSISEVLYGQRIGHYSLDEYINYLGLKQVEQSYVFTVVRDPVERLYSAWKYAVKGGTQDGGVHNPMFFKTPEFQDFDSFVQNWLVKQDLREIELLFKPQCCFIESEKFRLPIENIFYVDDLEPLEKKLSDLKKSSIKLPRRNVIHDPSKNNKIPCIQSQTIEIIKKIYSCDYEEFFKVDYAN